MSVRVKLEDTVSPYLERISDEKRAKALRTSTTAAAKAAVPVLRAATPRGRTGNLQGSVRHKAMRRSYGVGSVVAPMGKKASHRHLVIDGTKAHPIHGRAGGFLKIGNRYLRAVDHPGAKPNPFIDRAAPQMEGAAWPAFDGRISRYIDDGQQPNE